MSLGGPLPRAQHPPAGRVLSRGEGCRATEPPMASRPIRVTPATAAPAVPSTNHLRVLRLRRARRVQRKSLRSPHLWSDAYQLTRLERVCSPSSASPSSIVCRSAVLAGHSTGRAPSVGLCAHQQDDLGPPPGTLRRRADPAAWSSSQVRCGPSPASMCDGAAVGSLEATRLRRVLHCVPALARSKLRLGASVAARRISAHAGGGIGLRQDTRKDHPHGYYRISYGGGSRPLRRRSQGPLRP